MAHSNTLVVQGIADQLVDELDAYDRLLRRVPEHDCWPELLDALAECADRICRCAQSLQPIPLPFTGFLISRAELIHALWSSSSPHLGDEPLRVWSEHSAAVESLRRAARRVRQAAGNAAHSGHGAESASIVAAVKRYPPPRSM